ncbi:histone RNA hairpin-binding family protein [Babesia bovis T2Bo]|uniref:Histone RNA hairpin-binding protein RNA-binding domain-containing protein n=1 Tax=Babesia bovis TaxID=5865 RepID=A7ATH0_BABBO|nr:histone RNA hairpin-binding family protein [Babesia bovis T2Bo]EDO06231.1 histone RNA hairpin-binding family protein [Babesia bovis T2Bo]|eukprot:XP_001609799.1 hypothetical protein [Babesia bovis T2Bo]
MRYAKYARQSTYVDKDKDNYDREARASNRLKNITLTKLNAAYERYTATVPRELRFKELRNSWHPVTPDHRSSLSISQWNQQISNWRHCVYLWNGITDAQCALLSNAVRDGDIQAFLGICENTLLPESSEDGYASLLDSASSGTSLAPVLFKPSWFKGQITHSGFRTLEESEFLNRAIVISKSSTNKQFHERYKRYINSYSSNQ